MGDLVGKTLQTQIDELGDRMDAGFGEIKELMRGFDKRVSAVELREAGCQPLLHAGLANAQRKLDEHEADIKALSETIKAMEKTISALNETIASLKSTNRIISWIGGLMGAAVITWVLGQVLGLIK